MAVGAPSSGSLFATAVASTPRLVAYLGLAIALMVADRRGHYAHTARSFAQSLAGPAYWLASAPVEAMKTVGEHARERGELAAENARLKEETLVLRARLARLSALQDENTRLLMLLDVRQRLGLKAQLASLIDVDLDPFRQRIVLNRGAADGVHEGQAVMDETGVLGQVLTVEPSRAFAILITDASHALPVTVARTGLRTIAYGSGETDTLRLPHIPFSADVREGDALLTSGMGGRFPAGLPVGTVRKVTQGDAGTFALALATPAAGIARASRVLLLYDEPEMLTWPDGTSAPLEGPPAILAGSGAKPEAAVEPAAKAVAPSAVEPRR